MGRELWTKFDVRGPFRLNPRVPSAGYSDSHLSKGRKYHSRFEHRPGRKIVWEWEQSVINEILPELIPLSLHLDFAGGTGRIASVFEESVKRQYILDISASMLETAHECGRTATLICRDFREGVPEIGDSEADLITAFRFFPNAEPELREQAMAFLATKLKPNGRLICNNHRNFWSVPYLAQRLLFYRGGSGGMRSQEMMKLGRRHGLSLVDYFSFGIIPQTERFAIVPWKVVEYLENLIYRSTDGQHLLGYNTLFVFERAK